MLRQSKDREKMCNCMVLDVTAIFFWITAFFKKLPFLAKGLLWPTLVSITNMDHNVLYIPYNLTLDSL